MVRCLTKEGGEVGEEVLTISFPFLSSLDEVVLSAVGVAWAGCSDY